MTDNEIIKALECCCVSECDECPYDEQTACVEILKEGTLALINRQRAEIERYKGVIKILEKDVDAAKSEAYKEFADRFKDKVAHIPAWGAVAAAKIDNTLAELTEHKETVSMIDGHIEE